MSEAYQPRRILVTGGLGFIASHLVNYLVAKYPDILIVNLDRQDYCSSLKNITVADSPNYRYIKGDMASMDLVTYILETYEIDTIMNLAAQSSVDHSENNSMAHVQDNVVALNKLLEAVRRYGKIRRFLHISTDECTGDQADGTAAHEDSLLLPNNVYSATKAAGEMIVRAYRVSYKIPLLISRSNNIYGHSQHPSKIWPRFITQLLKGEKMTIHGKGDTRRNFLHVSDKVRALETILLHGKIGEIYNIGTNNELSVMEVAEILRSKICPEKKIEEVVTFVDDRGYNDLRYLITSDKIRALGWEEKEDFNTAVDEMIEWYSEHGDDHWQ